MSLGQLVLEELARLRAQGAAELRALPPYAEREVRVGGKAFELQVYREEAASGRVIIVVKAFDQKFLYASAAAEGFAIAPDNSFDELRPGERATLY
jgi:hypothetical protein